MRWLTTIFHWFIFCSPKISMRIVLSYYCEWYKIHTHHWSFLFHDDVKEELMLFFSSNGFIDFQWLERIVLRRFFEFFFGRVFYVHENEWTVEAAIKRKSRINIVNQIKLIYDINMSWLSNVLKVNKNDIKWNVISGMFFLFPFSYIAHLELEFPPMLTGSLPEKYIKWRIFMINFALAWKFFGIGLLILAFNECSNESISSGYSFIPSIKTDEDEDIEQINDDWNYWGRFGRKQQRLRKNSIVNVTAYRVWHCIFYTLYRVRNYKKIVKNKHQVEFVW